VYNPITINVLRQALEYSVLPRPLSIRKVSTYVWPDGTISGEYILCFEGSEIRDTFDRADLYDGSAAFVSAKDEIRDSFCDDVTPVRAWCDTQHDKLYVELYGRVTRYSDEYQMPLFGEEE